MDTAKIFYNGNSQAVMLPKECRFKTEDVYIKRINGVVMLIPKNVKWDSFAQSLDMFSDDFMTEKSQSEQANMVSQ